MATNNKASKTVLNREAWLSELGYQMKNLIVDASEVKDLPKYRISCGWPTRGALSQKRRVIGQCWDGQVSKAGFAELFISPSIADDMEVAATVAHELVHASIGTEQKHGKMFRDVVTRLGLLGKPTATFAGPEFKKEVNPILKKLGNYPHSAMEPNKKHVPVATRLLKITCATDEGYIARITQKQLTTIGAPLCACHMKPMKLHTSNTTKKKK